MSDPTMRFTLATRALSRCLDVAARFASGDATLPMINAVRFEVRAGWLLCTATDRFVAGQIRAELNPDDGTAVDGHALLDLRSVNRLRSLIRLPRGEHDADTVVLVGDGRFSTSQTRADRSAVTFHADVQTGGFPSLQAAITRGVERNSAGLVDPAVLDPRFASRFAGIGLVKHEPMRMQFHGIGPCVVHIGTDFRGLIMPIEMPKPRAQPEAGGAASAVDPAPDWGSW